MAKKQLAKLTDEQEAQMPEWVDRWIKVGHCTDEANWEAFERGAKACYAYAGIPWHGIVVRVGSPLVAMIVADVLAHGVAQGVWQGVWQGVAQGVRQGVAQGVEQGVRKRQSSAYIGGHFWISRQAYTSFYREVCGLELPGDLWDRDRAYALAQSSAGWWFPYRDFLVVSDRPASLHVDQFRPGQYRMHNTTGPAIAYRDGWSLYFVEGVRVEPHVVEKPDTITIDEIRQIGNAEERRVVTQQYGLLRYFRDLGAKALDSRFGEALFADPHDGNRWLICTDGSTGRIYQIRVPNRVETVLQAQAALNGVDPSLMLARS